MEAEVTSLEQQLEEKERILQNIPQKIIDRYKVTHTDSKKLEGIAYE